MERTSIPLGPAKTRLRLGLKKPHGHIRPYQESEGHGP